MTNWTDIHPNFTEELKEEWEGFGFDYDQVKSWVEDYNFSPWDAEFAIYIGDNELIISELTKEELEDLRKRYSEEIEKEPNIKTPLLKRKSEEIIDPNDRIWKNIRPDFTPELVQEWQRHSFAYEEIKEWIDIGMKITDADFCAWLRDVKNVDAGWILNNGETKELQNEYQQYLLITQQIQIS